MPGEAATSFRPGPRLGDELAARGEAIGSIAKRDLERYYALLHSSLRTTTFTLNEAAAVYRACVTHPYSEQAYGLLWAALDEVIRNLPDTAATAEPQQLIDRIRRLSSCQLLAIYDAAERVLPERDLGEELVRTGLVLREHATARLISPPALRDGQQSTASSAPKPREPEVPTESGRNRIESSHRRSYRVSTPEGPLSTGEALEKLVELGDPYACDKGPKSGWKEGAYGLGPARIVYRALANKPRPGWKFIGGVPR